MPAIDGKRIAFLAARGVEQVELGRPWQAVVDAFCAKLTEEVAEGVHI
jgi:hypothetical protein